MQTGRPLSPLTLEADEGAQERGDTEPDEELQRGNVRQRGAHRATIGASIRRTAPRFCRQAPRERKS